MKKNLLITTGGSGGHVIPATILHDHLSKSNEVFITTDKRGLKFFDKKTYKLKVINMPKLNNIFLFPLNLIITFFLILKSFFLLKDKKIEKIFCTGGYMSLPVILAGKLLNLNIYLVEPNQVLGRANKFFLNFCDKIFCYTEKIKKFPNNFKRKMVIINPLVKEEIYKIDQFVNIKKKFTILIVGGSQGANFFDQNLKNFIVNISQEIPIHIIQQTNENNIESLQSFYSKKNIANEVFSFKKNFPEIIKKADLCITRAGASTLAELSVLNIPFIAVPLPSSKDDHQLENAIYYKNNNCCWIIEQSSFDEQIEEILREIIIKRTDYLKKKENLKKLNYQNSWINVNQKILSSINEN